MFDVGGGEILLIVLAILLLFGPRKIPEIASMVGNGMRKVRRAQDEFTSHLRDISTQLETAEEVDRLPADASTQIQTTEQLTPDLSPDFSTELSTQPFTQEEVPEEVREGAPDELPDSTPSFPAEDAPIVVIQPAHGSVSRSR
jgi:sec-independent protein translocase protein TatA